MYSKNLRDKSNSLKSSKLNNLCKKTKSQSLQSTEKFDH